MMLAEAGRMAALHHLQQLLGDLLGHVGVLWLPQLQHGGDLQKLGQR